MNVYQYWRGNYYHFVADSIFLNGISKVAYCATLLA